MLIRCSFMHVYTHVTRMQKRVIDMIMRTVAYTLQKGFWTLTYVLSFEMCYNSRIHCISLTLNSNAHELLTYHRGIIHLHLDKTN